VTATEQIAEAPVTPLTPVVKESSPTPTPAANPKGLNQAGLLSDTALRKLRAQQEEFARTLSARLSVSFRLDSSVSLAGLQTIGFQKFVERSRTPLHFTLFKLDPLRGIGLLEIPPQLGLNIVNRLLGGSEKLENTDRALSDIESALLDQVSDVALAEWSGFWRPLQELRPALLGHEIEASFLNAISRETVVLELIFEVEMGESREQFRSGLPYARMEPLIRRLAGENESKTGTPSRAPAVAPQWNPQLDDVPVKLTAVCHGLELAVQALGQLKVGDSLPVDPQRFTEIEIHLGEAAKFVGTLGTSEGHWAVQLTRKLEA
jgi:flagellar motor switch protein FliM